MYGRGAGDAAAEGRVATARGAVLMTERDGGRSRSRHSGRAVRAPRHVRHPSGLAGRTSRLLRFVSVRSVSPFVNLLRCSPSASVGTVSPRETRRRRRKVVDL